MKMCKLCGICVSVCTRVGIPPVKPIIEIHYTVQCVRQTFFVAMRWPMQPNGVYLHTTIHKSRVFVIQTVCVNISFKLYTSLTNTTDANVRSMFVIETVCINMLET